VTLLTQFIQQLTRLKRANTKYGKAPHKPVLLISIIELIEKGIVTDNRVYVDTDLVGVFQENWRLLVNTLHSADFTQPFYLHQNQTFDGRQIMFFETKAGCQINAYIGSVNTLAAVLDYGYFAEDVFLLLMDTPSRRMINTVLLDSYFPDTKARFINSKENGFGYVHDLESYVLNEPEVQYKTLHIETEEDFFVRGGLFKKLVPKVYNNACCITGMRLESSFKDSFIDACHIVPFSVSHDDKVNNGIALCPNLHRAFDRGLISIDSNYRILVSTHLIEDNEHPYSLKQLNGKPINLPSARLYYPEPENLNWHRVNVFKN
jgi:putative restriction endonuclease